jgi:hypothetical protein
MMRKIILCALLLGLSLFTTNETSAQCTCSTTYLNITPHKEFKLADVVFVGKVVEIEKTDREKETGNYVETVKFEVKRAWKQDSEATVIIRNEIRGCLNGFDKDEEWLVYAYKQKDGTLGTACCCSRTNLLSEAAKDLEEFEAEGERPTKIRQPHK